MPKRVYVSFVSVGTRIPGKIKKEIEDHFLTKAAYVETHICPPAHVQQSLCSANQGRDGNIVQSTVSCLVILIKSTG